MHPAWMEAGERVSGWRGKDGGRRSLLGDSGLAQAIENGLELGQICRVAAPVRPGGAGAGDREGRLEHEPGLDSGTRLVDSTKLREGGSQRKICPRKIPVGLNRPPKACDRLFPTTKVELRDACGKHPKVGPRIARAQAQRLGDVSLRFFGATDKVLATSDSGMGAGEIWVQPQGIFALGDALGSAVGVNLDNSEPQMATWVVRNRGQSFDQLRLGRLEGRRGFGPIEKSAYSKIRASRSD